MVPSDAAGEYPALIGTQPAPLGRRVMARLIDVVFLVPIAMLAREVPGVTGVFSSASPSPAETGVAALVVMLPVVALLAILLNYAFGGWLPGDHVMRLRQVSVTTGRAPWLRGLAKYPLALVLGVVTLGIGAVYSLVTTSRHPLLRSPLERILGLATVDIRAGVNPLSAADLADELADPEPDQAESDAPSEYVPEFQPAELVLPASPAPVDVVDLVGKPSGGLAAPPRPAVVTGVTQVAAPETVDLRTVALPKTDLPRRTPTQPQTPPAVRFVLDDGGAILADSPGLLGRKPDPRRAAPGDEVYPVTDSARSISKTHLRFIPVRDGVWVEDLASTNGTRLVDSGGGVTALAPKRTVLVPFGSRLQLGDRTLKVERPA